MAIGLTLEKQFEKTIDQYPVTAEKLTQCHRVAVKQGGGLSVFGYREGACVGCCECLPYTAMLLVGKGFQAIWIT